MKNVECRKDCTKNRNTKNEIRKTRSSVNPNWGARNCASIRSDSGLSNSSCPVSPVLFNDALNAGKAPLLKRPFGAQAFSVGHQTIHSAAFFSQALHNPANTLRPPEFPGLSGWRVGSSKQHDVGSIAELVQSRLFVQAT